MYRQLSAAALLIAAAAPLAAQDRLHEAKTLDAARTAIERHHPELLESGDGTGVIHVAMIGTSAGEIERTLVRYQRPALNPNDMLPSLFAGARPADFHKAGVMVLKPGSVARDTVVLTWWERAVDTAPEPGGILLSSGRVKPDAAVLRRYVAQHHPQLLENGLPRGNTIWFLVDASGGVVASGVARADDSNDVEAAVDAVVPGVEIRSGHYQSVRGQAGWVRVALLTANAESMK